MTLRYGGGGSCDLHCGRCGSLLYSNIGTGPYVHVTLGTLVDSQSIRPSGHVFMGSKASWHEINDPLPQYAEFPSPSN
jgi:hypothetical protein